MQYEEQSCFVCDHCGQEIDEKETVCPRCGAEFSEIAEGEDEVNPVAIRTFNNPVEARIAQGLLESQGINSFVKDENMGYNYSFAVGGVKLMVREDEYEQALEILNAESEIPDEPVATACPACGSNNVEKKQKFNFLSLLALIFMLPANTQPSGNSQMYWKCYMCGNKWEE